jgi:hypothetical protein
MFKQFLLAAAIALCGAAAHAAEIDDILKRADAFRQPEGPAQNEVLVQTFKNGQPDKEKRFQVNTKPGGRSLVLFRSAGEVGQKVLMVGDDFWMIMPGSARPIRITPLQKLLGDAATGDIASLSWAGDYDGRVARETDCAGTPCLELDLAARRKTLSYQKIVLYVAKRDYRPIHADLYASSNRKLKQVDFDTEQRDGQQRVVRMAMQDEVQVNRRTVVSILSTRAHQFGDELFNPMYLSRSDVKP